MEITLTKAKNVLMVMLDWSRAQKVVITGPGGIDVLAAGRVTGGEIIYESTVGRGTYQVMCYHKVDGGVWIESGMKIDSSYFGGVAVCARGTASGKYKHAVAAFLPPAKKVGNKRKA